MAMEPLGRTINVVPIANGVAIDLRDCAGVTFVCTGTDTFTLTTSATFGGAYVTPGNIIVRKYTNTATDGTAAWVRAAQAASNAFTGAGTVAVYVDGTWLPDTHRYIKCTRGAAGLVTAILGDLDVQRAPANLKTVSS